MRPIAFMWVFLATLSGCASTGPTSISDKTVYTPYFQDNRVFYISSKNDAATAKDTHVLLRPRDLLDLPTCSDVTADHQAVDDNCLSIPKHQDPLALVIKSAYLPVLHNGPKFRDIALVIEYSASQESSPSDPMVVWYQRNVTPGQALNFSDLVVAYTESWDDRYSPYMRIRLVDVVSERNSEVAGQLAQASKLSSGLLATLTGPIGGTISSIASSAAQSILRNQRNRVLLDYTFQLYSYDRAKQHRNARFNVLLDGRYALFGRRIANTTPDFWSDSTFSFNEDRGAVELTNPAYDAPVVVVAVVNEELLVPAAVINRSTELTTRLTQAATQNASELSTLATNLSASVKAYAAREDIYKNDSTAGIEALDKIFDDPNSPEDVKNYVVLTVKRLTGCSGLNTDNFSQWWDGANSDLELTRQSGKLLLKAPHCDAAKPS